jgi:hypothetical protein
MLQNIYIVTSSKNKIIINTTKVTKFLGAVFSSGHCGIRQPAATKTQPLKIHYAPK